MVRAGLGSVESRVVHGRGQAICEICRYVSRANVHRTKVPLPSTSDIE